MKSRPWLLLLVGAGLLAFSLGCGGEEDQPTEPDELDPQVTTIEVTPSSAELNAVGATQDFEATAKDQNGNTMSGVSFNWSVSPDSVASVDDEGRVTAEANGAAAVEAATQGVTGSADLTVDQTVSRIVVTPDSVRLDAAGDTVHFSADPQDANGHTVGGTEINWASSDTSVVTVDSTGLATAREEGTARVEASAGDVTGSSSLMVEDATRTALSCEELSFDPSSALPLDTVRLTGIPDTLREPLFAQAASDQDTGKVFVWRTGGRTGQMVVPAVPGGSGEGGEITLRVGDEERICPAQQFTVEGLAAASGAFAALVDSMDTLLQLQGRLVGVNTERLPQGSLDTLPKHIWPLAVARDLIDGPDNPNSLRQILAGEAPLLEGDSVNTQLTDRLLARTGMQEALAAQLDSMRERLEGGGSSNLSASTDEVGRFQCDDMLEIKDAATLNSCMSIQFSQAFDMKAHKGVRRLLGWGTGAVGLANPLAAVAAGALLHLHSTVQEGTARLLPSKFTDGGFSLTETSYLEDEEGPDHWKDNWVKAANQGWSLDKTVLETLLQVAGATGAYDDFINGFLKESDIWEDLGDWAASELTTEVISRTPGSNVVRIEAETTPQISINAEKWSHQRLRGGNAVTFVSHQTYEPRNVGTVKMFVGTAEDKFAGAHFESSKSVEVKRLRVLITPDTRTTGPGKSVDFKVEVRNAAHPKEIEATVDAGQKILTKATDGEAVHTVEVTTPAERAAYPVGLTVRHTAKTGARGHSDEPRLAQAIIYKPGSLVVEPGGACVEYEQTQDFDARVRGVEDPEIKWEASAGTVDRNGMFTAPSSDATVTVTATSAEDSDVSDMAVAHVRSDCDEWWSVVAGGATGSGDEVLGPTDTVEVADIAFFNGGLDVTASGSFKPGFNAIILQGGPLASFVGKFESGEGVGCGTDSDFVCFGEIVKETDERVRARFFGAARFCPVGPGCSDEAASKVPITVWYSAEKIGVPENP